MASHPELPEEYKSFLKPSPESNTFDIIDWTQWLDREKAKIGKVMVFSSHDTKFESRILGIKRGRMGDDWLFLAPFEPDPPRDFFEKKPAIVVKNAFVEHGFVVGTSFPAKPKGSVTIDKVGGVLVDDIFKPRVTLKPHLMPLPSDNTSMIFIALNGKRESLRITALGMRHAHVTGSLKQALPAEGVKFEQAAINLKYTTTKNFKVKGRIKQTGDDSFEVIFTKISDSDSDFLANWVDELWIEKVSRMENRKAIAKKRERDAATGDYLKHLHKTHFFLLSDDTKWAEMLGEIGIVRHIDEKDQAYIVDELGQERCDMLIADFDYWGARTQELIEKLQANKEFAKIPTFWITGKKKTMTDEKNRTLLENGVYDILDRRLDQQKFLPFLNWALKETTFGATGDSMVIISPSARQQYRLGMRLRMRGFKIIKSTTRENPLSTLNTHLPRWILVDATSIGDGYDMILEPCLNWVQKGTKKRDVFLLTAGIDPESAVRWMSQGLSDIIVYDPVTSHPLDRLQAHIQKALQR